jgi:MOSC domain-containing protein YiiM
MSRCSRLKNLFRKRGIVHHPRMTNGSQVGKVASLHLHPVTSGDPLQAVDEIRAEADKGILGDARIFGRKDRKGGPSRRQISLIAREQIAEHAATLGLPGIAPGAVRANIETTGIDLMSLLGQEVRVGGAVLFFYEARTPCGKMDKIAPGLQKLMSLGRQGVMARIVSSGDIRVGDAILVAVSGS